MGLSTDCKILLIFSALVAIWANYIPPFLGIYAWVWILTGVRILWQLLHLFKLYLHFQLFTLPRFSKANVKSLQGGWGFTNAGVEILHLDMETLQRSVGSLQVAVRSLQVAVVIFQVRMEILQRGMEILHLMCRGSPRTCEDSPCRYGDSLGWRGCH